MFNLQTLTPEAYDRHRHWMRCALAEAEAAGAAGDVPVGAVVVDGAGQCLAQGGNRKERDRNPTAHAEILVIQAASQSLQTWRLQDCTLYVTLEPCPMCTGAILQARLGLLVYGTDDPKTGTVRSLLNLPDHPCSNHRLPVLAGIEAAACRAQLSNWFAQRRRG